MANVNNNLLNQGINEARKYLEYLKVSVEQEEDLDKSAFLQSRSRVDSGSLQLTREDIEKENQAVSTIHNAVKGKKKDKWSRTEIDRLFQDAIFHSLDITQQSSQEFDQRLEEALTQLRSSLDLPLKKWEFYHVVLGLDVGEERRKIGNVEFFHADEENLEQILNRINDITDDSLNSPEEKEQFKDIYRQQVLNYFSNAAIAVLDVLAGDIVAARNLALEELQTTLDIINFYSLSIHNEGLRVRVFLPGDAVGTQSLNITFKEDESINLEFPRHGPLVNFHLTSLNEEHSNKLGLTRLNHILINPAPNKIEQQLLAAVRIAGKAVSHIRREDSFLLHAIALESVLVGGKEITDLTYKLSTRCAHLLGKDLEMRKEIKKEVSRLYGIRSAIVHRGENDFADADFFKIRRYTQNVLVALLSREEFKNFTNKEELNQWFDDKMLG